MKNENLFEETLNALNERGVEISDIIECTVFLQENYIDNIRELDLEKAIIEVLNKREVQHAVLTGIAIDKRVEEGVFSTKEISNVIKYDAGLYGVDEVLAYGICNLYGSIAMTNFGYIDKVKPGIIGELNDNRPGECHTFLDDIVGAIAAAGASKLAHTVEK